MVVDVLNMLDGALKGGSSKDVSSPDDREGSFGAIFEERMKADSGKAERAGSTPDKGPGGTNQVKPKSTEDNNENKPDETAQTVTEKTDAAKTGATEEKSGVTENIVDKNRSANEMKLTEEQLSKLAAMMGFSMEQMGKLEILLAGGMPTDQQEAVAKLVELLDLDKEDAEMLFKQLRSFSMEIKPGDNQTGKELTDIQKPDKAMQAGQSRLNQELTDVQKPDKAMQAGQSKLTKELTDVQKPDKAIQTNQKNLGKVLTDAQKPDKETQTDGGNLDKEIDELLNSAKKSGGNIKADLNSVKDHFVKAVQSNNASQTVEANTINVVKSDKSAVTQTAALKEIVDTSSKATENKVIDQIVEKVKILSFPKSTTAKIALKPPSLGWVDIKIVMHETGARTTIVVESAAVKQMVDQNIDQLKAALNQQGISVEEMNVSVEQQDARSSGDSERQNDDGNNDFDEQAENEVELHLDSQRLADEIVKAAYNSHLNITV